MRDPKLQPTSPEWPVGGGETGRLVRETDWSTTALGARETWPAALRGAVSLILASDLPLAVLWGRELLFFCNDAYRAVAGLTRPHALGRSAREMRPDVLHVDEPAVAAVMERGETVYLEDELFPVDRHGRREDAYFTVCCSPWRGDDGAVAGTLVTLLETTRRVQEQQALESERDRARAEAGREGEALRTSELRYRTLFEQLQEQERRLRAMFENVALGITEVGTDGRMQSLNRRLTELLGYEGHELVGTEIDALTAPGDRERSRELNGRLNRGELDLFDYEKRYLRKDGTPVWVHVTVSAIRDAAGVVQRAVGTVEDISARKRAEAARLAAEEAVRTRERQFRALVENLASGVALVDSAGRFSLYNAKFLEMFGLASGSDVENVNSRDWSAWQVCDESGRLLELDEHPVRKAALTRASVRGQTVGVRSPGARELAWMIVSAEPLFGAHGELESVICTYHDITGRKRVEEALRASEERFRSVLENMSEGVMLFDASGDLIYQNAASSRIHGFELQPDGRIEGEVLTATWRGWDENGRPLPPDEWPMARVLRKERFQNQIVHARRVETGHEFYASYNGGPILDEAGNITLGFITIRDIGEEVRAAAALRQSGEALRESESKYRSLFDHMPMGSALCRVVFEGDRPVDYVHEEVNRAYEEHTGVRREDVLGRRITEVIPDARDPGRFFVEMFGDVARTGRPARYETDVPSLGRCFEGTAYSPKPGYFATLFLDVTERKKAQAAVDEMNARLVEADRRKNEFLAMLSHELRNPLAPIKSSLYVLERAPAGGPQAKRAHDVIGRQVVHMTRLIDDLLDVTRITRGKVRLRRERLELCELVRRTAEDHRALFAAGGIELEVVTCEPGLHVDGDPTRLGQVLGNLLANAAKFTPRGGRVHLALARTDDGAAEIHVRDSGAGIAPDLIGKLFEPFVQAEVTLDRSQGGLGLGLALVRGIVELHGGRVSAHSQGPGRGAEFVVRLPLAETGTPAPREGRARVEDGARKPMRVLVIEDNADAADSLKEALELSGHAVETAPTGHEGIVKARVFRPDVVLCDIGLPGIDGFEVARRMRRDPALRSACLVALSGYAGPEDLERSKEAGFAQHLAKPPDLGELETTLWEVCAAARREAPPGSGADGS